MDYRVYLIVPLAFICEFIDSSLGMGYGTILTPLLLLAGFEPFQVVPAVLFSEFITGITAGIFHHKLKNVDFNFYSKDSKVALILSIFAVIGTVAAVYSAVKLPAHILKIWIGAIVVFMGVFILATFNRKPRFTWRKIIFLGTVASFNKGISGGGYGPLVMGGQIISGIGAKNAIGITSVSEGVTCFTGIILYFLLQSKVDWVLAPSLTVGALLSVPFAAHAVRKISERKIKVAIAIVILILGFLTLWKVFIHS